MRILIASLMAVTAVAFAAPSFAQEATPPTTLTPPAKTAKPRAGTAAYCNTLKTESAKASCLKRVQTAAAKSHKPAPKKPAVKPDNAAQVSTPAAAAPAPVTTQQQGSVAVPPLPQKTI
ncbi:MAG: hypothetical protein JOY81_12200 [Alphaproteobacteria bacterium]|nr:hypothetical protein [Alphaproteobacteria bacterium]